MLHSMDGHFLVNLPIIVNHYFQLALFVIFLRMVLHCRANKTLNTPNLSWIKISDLILTRKLPLKKAKLFSILDITANVSF